MPKSDARNGATAERSAAPMPRGLRRSFSCEFQSRKNRAVAKMWKLFTGRGATHLPLHFLCIILILLEFFALSFGILLCLWSVTASKTKQHGRREDPESKNLRQVWLRCKKWVIDINSMELVSEQFRSASTLGQVQQSKQAIVLVCYQLQRRMRKST